MRKDALRGVLMQMYPSEQGRIDRFLALKSEEVSAEDSRNILRACRVNDPSLTAPHFNGVFVGPH